MRLLRLGLTGALLLAVTALVSTVRSAPNIDDWPSYGHDPGGMRYSPLTDLTKANVSRLAVAWTYHTGEQFDGSGGKPRSGFETTPIVVDGGLYFTTPTNRVIALDPNTGAERWTFDPKIDPAWDYGDGLINRGLATWTDDGRQLGQTCQRRLFEATLDARLVALDAATGQPCADFGEKGFVSLRDVPGYRDGAYHMTSPPAVIDDLVVIGSAIDDNTRVDMPSGVVRAFDARTGAERWHWDPIPPNRTNEPGDQSPWQSGAANAWSIMTVDPARHLIFVPTGSASPDYYGGFRQGEDRWANAVVALRAKTGAVAWGFQLVHHDLWDYDTASPPVAATIMRNGQRVPVVIAANKTGFVFVLNRDTGAPVFPIEERPVPQSDVPGETTSPTQPFPVDLPALAPQRFRADDAWGPTPADRDACRQMIQGLRNEGIFTPPSVQGSLVVPGNLGGLTWGGFAFDPDRHLVIASTNNLPAMVKLIPRREYDTAPHNERAEYARQLGAPYGMLRRFLQSPSDLPCGKPPWGSLVALDLETGQIRWSVPLGSMEGFGGAQGAPAGSAVLGGPIATASGLVFVAGTVDPYLRAFDVETGRELWKGALPASGHATPMTYKLTNGRQLVVVAAGGHAKITEEKLGDALVGFAIPK